MGVFLHKTHIQKFFPFVLKLFSTEKSSSLHDLTCLNLNFGYCSQMGFVKLTWVILFCWAFSSLCFRAHSAAPLSSLKLLKAPHAFSHLSSATFVFDVLVGGDGDTCSDCSLSCKLDDGVPSDCVNRRVSYTGLHDGNHTFEVCSNVSYGVGCSSYNWTVDTVPPTAYVTAPTSFTNALNFSVNISFSEPCVSGGGFGCSSVNTCNLLVYGAGQVLPSSLQILQPNLKYSLLVGLSSTAQYGRVILVMDKNFCSDIAGNSFTRTDNSSFYVHFDRRNVSTNLRTRISERLVQLNSATRTVQATNDYSDLKVYLNFSEPVLNSSTEVLSTLTVSQGSLLPTSGKSLGNRRFGFLVANVSTISIITVNLDSTSIISRQGTPVSPISPLTFLYDSQRPIARLSTTANMRTKEHTIPISVKFTKPVFGFNSSYLSISGGHLQNFHEISTSIYTVDIRADDEFISVNVPENVTGDVAGNMNLASNILQVRHYSVPKIAFIVAVFATAAFVATSFVAGLLTISIASLQSVGAFSRSTLLLTNPARNLFKIAFYIQVFALSRWLAVTLPVEYYEFARGLQWSIPYFHLPWECGQVQPVMVGSTPVSVHSYMSEIPDVGVFQNQKPTEDNLSKAASLYGLPLTPGEYRLFFESQNMKPEAEFITDPKNSNGWRDFDRSMFWLAVIAGSLILLHALALFILRFRKKPSEKKRDYGQLTLPRFEIFLILLALPCISEASASLIRGGASSGIIVGILFLGFVAFVLLALLLFLTVGITFGKLLQYKEVHQEGEKFHWYQDIVRVTLGPGKRGQWTWKNQTSSIYLIIFGPLFEDLRGPPKYMLTQISGSHPHKYGDSIIASEDENEDAEAPFIQKLFGILRIYYTLLESVKRVTLGIVAGAYMEDWWSRTPTIALLSITSFQLFFLVLKKPFIKKKVQLVEIIAISCEVGLFATCLVLLEKDLSAKCESKVGIFMITLFLLGFLPQMINQWYALYRQTKRLDPADKSFLVGLKVASIGILLFLIPEKFTKKLESRLPVNLHWNKAPTDPGSSAERHGSSGSRSSGATERWLKQLREMAKASFSKEGNGGPTDPSSSRTARWSEFWSKRSGSSSMKTSTDMKAQPRKGLDKDLEDIFASK